MYVSGNDRREIDIWWGGHSPRITDLIAQCVRIDPNAIAAQYDSQSVTFQALAQVTSMLAPVMAAQGMGAEAAVAAAVPAVLPTAAVGDPADVARRTAEIVDEIGRNAAKVLGTSQWQRIDGVFDSVVTAHSGRVAVRDESGAELTYGELSRRATVLARTLRDAGAGPESLVGIGMGRTTDLIVAIVAVLKSGAAYLPLDVSNPTDRLAYIVSDAQPAVILTDAGTDASMAEFGIATLNVDSADGGSTGQLAPLNTEGHPEGCAYVIYTSGSTGKPKGVVVTHRNVLELMAATDPEYRFDERDVWTMFHSYAFDFSVWEIWGALLFGGTLVVVDSTTARTPDRFAELISEYGVTVLNQTPSAFYQLAQAIPEGNVPECLQYIIFGGEALDFTRLARWYRRGENATPQLVNMYGITETCVHATYRALDADVVAASVAADVGEALSDLKIQILDSRLRPVPVGVTGEIYVSGPQLARGYLRRPDLCAARYVANPFGEPGDRMYRSGDLGRRNSRGGIDYLGRGDQQVQLRGFRVELGEVESALIEQPSVASATVVVSTVGGADRLAGYVVPDGTADVDPQAIRASVARFLPSYMVPDVVMVIDALPLTANGKLDKRALPHPEFVDHADYVAPATDVEKKLVAIYQSLLGTESRISVESSLFEIGGNSLVATQVAARAAETFGVTVPVRTVFENPSVRALAGHIGQQRTFVAISGVDQVDPAVPVVQPRPDRIPLSLAQQRLWFINELEPMSAAYNIPLALRLSGDVDEAALCRAFADVVDRHEVLRTRFISSSGIPEQVIGDDSMSLEVQSAHSGDVDALIARHMSAGFDLAAAPPLRAGLYRLTDCDQYLLLVVAHHIIVDGFSLAPLASDLLSAYVSRRSGDQPTWPPLELQYADYTLWQRSLLGAEDAPTQVRQDGEHYWRRQLAAVPDLLALPTDRPRPTVASMHVASMRFTMESELVRGLEKLAQQHNSTVFIALHASLAALLSRLSGSSDIVVGTPIAGRGAHALDPMVGMFVNTLALRSAVTADLSFSALLAQTTETDLSAMDNAFIPFERVVELVDPARSQAYSPIAQVMLALQNMTLPDLDAQGMSISAVDMQKSMDDHDLGFYLTPAGPGQAMDAVVLYATDLFDASTAESIVSQWKRLVAYVVSDPQLAVGDVPLVTEAQRDHVLAMSRGIDYRWQPPSDLAAVFHDAWLRHGDRRAVRDDRGRELSYAQLGSAVAHYADYLADQGIGRGSVVAVRISRSIEMVVAVHATISLGASYVPVDPQAPSARGDDMVLRSGADLCIVDSEPITAAMTMPDHPGRAPAVVHPDDAIYTLFTSGSTGKPKGVTVTHRAAFNRMMWVQQTTPVVDDDVVLWKTPATFDVSVPELMLPFIAGASVMVVKPDGHRDPAYLADVISGSGVTWVHFVPSMLAAYLDANHGSLPESVRLVNTSGEALPPTVARDLLGRTSAVLTNLYGPTEAAVDVTAYEVPADVTAMSLGEPVFNTSVYLLDSRLNPVPAGVSGEVYLAGVQLARGYVGQFGLTAERFVADPWGAPGTRMYRTGDVARRSASGLEYQGRSDFQVKIRGQRIELGEIEAALLTMVSRAVVVARTDAHLGDQLVAYVSGDDIPAVDTLTDALAQRLPQYMMPSAFVTVDDFPLGPTGKLDRRALPEPEFATSTYQAPSTPTEEIVASVFADVLGRDVVGVRDSFFSLGGNSLSATRVSARIGEELGVAVPVRLLFDHPTVRGLSGHIGSAGGEAGPQLEPVTRGDTVRWPLSPAQQRIWFLNQLAPDTGSYNIPFALTIDGDLDVQALSDAFVDVVNRHEALRTRYPDDDGVPYQLVENSVAVGHVMVSSSDGLTTRGFDLANDLPIRVAIESDGSRHTVTIVLHHISADGASLAPLVRDVLWAYQARRIQRSPRWNPLPIQYIDYAAWQRKVLGDSAVAGSVAATQLSYWRDTLAGAPDCLDMPTDRPRPVQQSGQGGRVDFAVDAELRRAIGRLAQRYDATAFMVVHAAWSALLARWTGSSDIAVGTPVAGRGAAALDDVIGMFVNTLVLRVQVDPAETFGDLVGRVVGNDLAAFAHADVTFDQVVEAIDPVRSQAFSPLYQVGLSFQNTEAPRVDIDGATVTVRELDIPDVKADLSLTVLDPGADADDEGYRGAVHFASDLFDEATAARVAQRLVAVLYEVTADPTVAVGDIDWLVGADRVALDAAQRTESALITTGHTIPELLGDYRHEGVATVFGDRIRRYPEFGSRVTALARRLIAAGVGPDVVVGVPIDRSDDLVVALHAVVVAGGAYLAIDQSAPVERARYMAEASNCQLLLVDSTTDAEVISGLGLPVVEIDLADGSADVEPITDADRLSPLRPDNLAYVLFTSGSTGKPKGVMVSHRNICQRLVNGQNEFAFVDTDVVIHKTPFTFDVSLPEIFGPFIVGAQSVIARPDGHRDPLYLDQLMRAHRVTYVHFVPSMLAAYLETVLSGANEGADRFPPSLREIGSGGEEVTRELADAVARYSSARLVDLYGPTEVTVECVWGTVDFDATGPVSIGLPCESVTAHILDSRLHPVPVGVVGELYLQGPMVTRGYASRGDLTAGRFVAAPSGWGERMYRSGDLVSRNADGTLNYRGRADFQLKIRGLRIEPGEIEQALEACPGVVRAVVTAADHPRRGKQLVAHIVAANNEVGQQARELLRSQVPSHMVPDAIMVLDTMPLGSSGKIDRKALPPIDIEASTDDSVAPSTPVEELIAGIFADLTGVGDVSVTDSFFDIGGNSLSATRLAARISKALDCAIVVRDVFDHPTVRELAMAAGAATDSPVAPLMPRADRHAPAPLSLAASRMWFVNQYDTTSAAYNVPIALRLSGELAGGPIDPDALALAIADVVDRHEILRTTFEPDDNGQPRQHVHSRTAMPLDIQVGSGTSAQIHERALDLMAGGFDVVRQLPIRAGVWRIDDADTAANDVALVIVIHHIATDGESRKPLIDDVLTAYAARAAGGAPTWQPLEIQYADYSVWQREMLGSRDDADSRIRTQLDYWINELADMPTVLALPHDRKRPAQQSLRGSKVDFVVPDSVAVAVRDLARRNGATEFMVVHTALAVLLARLSASEDVSVGAAIAGRGAAELDPLIGMFVNTLVLRTQVRPDQTFTQLLAQVASADLDAFARSQVPFEMVVDEVAPDRSTAHAPITQVGVTYHGAAPQVSSAGDFSVTELVTAPEPAKMDLTFGFARSDDGLSGQINYAADLFDHESVERMAQMLVQILQTATDDTQVRVGDIELADQASAVTEPSSAPAATVVDLLAHSGIDDRTALVAPSDPVARNASRQMTYAEMNSAINALARLLIDRGVGADDVVAVGISRSIESVIASLAVISAGAAFVPIDPQHPAQRREHMMRDSGAVLGLALAASEMSDPGVPWIVLDDPATDRELAELSTAPVTDSERRTPLRTDHLAYLIYTSGSTGVPKAVAVSHRGFANLVAANGKVRPTGTPPTVLLLASVSFDGAFFEVMDALASAGTAVIAPENAYAGEQLADVIRANQVDSATITPAVLATLEPADLPMLTTLRSVGEACPPELVNRWAPGRTFINAYGPAEASIWTTAAVLTAGQPVSIGRPIDGVTAEVLDTRLHPVPTGVAGELYLHGPGLARGYHGQSGLTAGRFVAAPGGRRYRTGDLVRWTNSGQLEYLGRTDFQVKVRGQRLELAEIDSVFAAMPEVEWSLTKTASMPTGRDVLVTYIKARENAGLLDTGELNSRAAGSLAEYMVPDAVIEVPEVPLTRNGKVDRNALPHPEVGAAEVAGVAPRTEVEGTIARAFADVLGLDADGLSIDESFFALGGDSIISIRLVTELKAHSIALTAREIFEHKTVRRLAEAAENAGPATILAELAGGGAGEMPLTPIAEWFFSRSDNPEVLATFSQSALLSVPGDASVDDITAAISAVVGHHPMLSARMSATGAVAGCGGEVTVAQTSYARENAPGTPGFESLVQYTHGELCAQLAPESGRMVAAAALLPAAGAGAAGRVLLTIHHLAVDAVSWRTIVTDLVTAYQNIVDGSPIMLPPNGTSMRRWAHALSDAADSRTDERDLWQAQTGSEPLLGQRPVSSSDTEGQRRTVVALTEPDVVGALLTDVPHAYRGGVNDGLLAALASAVGKLHRARGRDCDGVSVLLEGHGREEQVVPGADLARTVGWFTTAFPVRLPIGDAADVSVPDIADALNALPDKGIGYGMVKYLTEGGFDEQARGPQISFNYLGRREGAHALADMPFMPAADDVHLPAGGDDLPAEVVVAINCTVSDLVDGPQLRAEFAYLPSAISASDIDTLVQYWQDALREVVQRAQALEPRSLTPEDIALVDVTADDLAVVSGGAVIDDVWPLAPLQAGLHFHATLADFGDGRTQDRDIYLTQSVVRLEGAVDTRRFERAVAALLARHDILRSSFRVTPTGTAVGVIAREVATPWSHIDLRGMPNDQAHQRLQQISQDQKAPFDVTSAPLIRLTLVSLSDQSHALVVTTHHLLLDGWSGPLLLRDLFALYAVQSRTDLLPAVPQFSEFLAWLNRRDQGSDAAVWQSELAGLEGPTLVAPLVGAGQPDPRDLRIAVDAQTTARLYAVARANDITVATIVQCAWGILLSRIVGQSTVVFGETVSGRPSEVSGVGEMIGLFINTIAVRMDIDPLGSTLDHLHRLQQQKIRLIDHHHVGLADIARAAGMAQLFDTLTVFESYPVDTQAVTAQTDASGLRVVSAQGSDASHYPLNLASSVVKSDDGDELLLTVKYLASTFDDATITSYGRALERVVRSIASSPTAPIGEIDLLSDDDRRKMLSGNDNDAELPTLRLADLWAHAVARYPDRIAVSDSYGAWTYAELDAISNRLARALMARGARPDTAVVVALHRSALAQAVLWAVTKTGAAYLPVDPKYPSERLVQVISDAHAVCGITDSATVDILPAMDWLTFDADTVVDQLAGQSDSPVMCPAHLDDVAYIIYTSGSTGRPKGVAVPHRGIGALSSAISSAMQQTEESRVLGVVSPAFDASIFESVMAFAAGATLYPAPSDCFAGPELAEFVTQREITHAIMIPSVLATVGSMPTIRSLMAAGEALAPALAQQWCVGRRLTNGYGPTETTVIASYSVIDDPEQKITIGEPIPGQHAYVLDAQLRPVPFGIAGDLYLAGPMLALGYRGRPGLTAERFVADPWRGGRMYRTGDIVRASSDGQLDYLGRSDFQVKVRGLRIELGEVESALRRIPGVTGAVVIGVSVGDTSELAGYVTAEPTIGDAQALAALLSRDLPDYMVPSSLQIVPSIPLTPVGKVDRNALPEPVFAVQADYVEPTGDAEIAIAAVMAELLELPRVGACDNFFDIGGNSLSATRLVSRVADVCGARLSVRVLFDHPTPRLLAAAVADSGSGGRPPLVAGPRPELIPLSYAQQRMWFLNQFVGDDIAYNIPLALRMSGPLDVAAMEAALNDVVAHHESLRTSYPAIDGTPYQSVHQAGLECDRWESVDEQMLASLIADDLATAFDVAAQIPVRARLYGVGGPVGVATEHVLMVVIHHISADGASLAPLARDLMVAYRARLAGDDPQLPPLDVQYADYALWQRHWLGSEDDSASELAAQARYWREHLAEIPDVLDLPTDRPRTDERTMAGASVIAELGEERRNQLVQLASRYGCTTFHLVHALTSVLLARLSGTSDIVVGTPVAGRGERALDDLVGMFVNTLALRTHVDGHARFVDVLDNIRDNDVAAMEHSELPFERLVDIIDPVRSSAHSPIFQVMVSLADNADTGFDLPELSVSAVAIERDAVQTDLAFSYAVDPERGLVCTLHYATEIFDAETVQRWSQRLIALADQVLADPTAAVGDLDVMVPGEAQQIREFGRGDGAESRHADRNSRADQTVLHQYELVAAQRGDALAMDGDGDVQITHFELASRVNRLARELISRGVGAGARVAVGLDHSAEQTITVMAIMAAGAAYVPVERSLPGDRIAHILATSDAVLLIVDGADGWDGVSVPTLSVQALETAAQTQESTSVLRSSRVTADSLAYVLFTSGSTGMPKGVEVTHGGLWAHMQWFNERLGVGSSSRVLVKTPITFDVSVAEMWSPLLAGGTIVLSRSGGYRDPGYLVQRISEASVSLACFVPTLLDTLLDASYPLPDSLSDILVGGEALHHRTATRLADISRARLHNYYGPTEVTIDATGGAVALESPVTLGTPGVGVVAQILDRHLRPVPIGVIGELYLGGPQVARGYAGRPVLTAERFVADPGGTAGERLYRTGDLVRWTDCGEIEYFGRSDFQVKVRGQRIELGEIEQTLSAVDTVAAAVVVVYRDDRVGEQLVAYLVPAQGVDLDLDQVRRDSAERLPRYMIPAAMMVVDHIPHSSAGKVMRNALPKPQFDAVSEYRAPSTPVEEVIATVIGDVLAIAAPGIDDSFFDLGGNSLSATRVTSRVGTALGKSVPVRAIFDHPTVAELAQYVQAGTTANRVPLERRNKPGPVPVSMAQQRIWFINQYDVTSSAYNIPMILRLSGDIDDAALRAAMVDVVDRHESLRTTYRQGLRGIPEQHVHDITEAADHMGWQVLTAADDDELRRTIDTVVHAGFDVTQQVPVRARLIHVGPSEAVLVVVIHHIATDGASMVPLTRDVMTAYRARHDGEVPSWSPLPVQYGDYAWWQREVLGSTDDPDSLASQQLTFWRDELASLPELLAIPTDRPRPQVASLRGAAVDFAIDADTGARVHQLAAKTGTTPFMVLQAALATLLSRLSGQSQVAISTPIAGRGERELDDLVGMFVNTLVLKSTVDGGSSFNELLAHTRTTDLAAFCHSDVPFERIVEELNPARSQAHAPLSQVLLTYQGEQSDAELELPGLRISGVPNDVVTAKVDLQLGISDRGSEGLVGQIAYATDLFDASTVARLAERFVHLLSAVTVNPARAVGDHDVLDESEYASLVPVNGDDSSAPIPLGQLLTRGASRNPDAIAVVAGRRRITYRQFDKQSTGWAQILRERGIGCGDVVALGMGRSLEFVLAVAAVAKIGAAYVPVDPGYPEDRKRHMLVDSGAAVGIASDAALSRLPETVPWLSVDELGIAAAARDDSGGGLVTPVETNSVAYLIYSSGTTGIPKGCAVTHAGLADFVNDLVRRIGVSGGDRVLAYASPSFDASVMEYLLALSTGATLVVVPAGIVGGADLTEFLRDNPVDHSFLTPAVLNSLEPHQIAPIRSVMMGGEKVPDDLAAQWIDAGHRVFNAYGPTEATIYTGLYGPLRIGDPMRIGGPMAGLSVTIVDARLRPVPVGVAGDIYVSGTGLAQGYMHRPGLTSSAFVANPYSDVPGARMYRTGDVGCWRRDADGSLAVEYLGRSDFQVKLRGLRIELGEVESALLRHPSITSAVVVGVDQDGRQGSAVTSLAAYVVAGAADTAVPEGPALREYLAATLPTHMIPSSFTVMDALPLSPVGKVDRRELPRAEITVGEREFVAPAPGVERDVAQVFASVLALSDDVVGATDSFFDLGGNSLAAAQVASALRSAGYSNFELPWLFADPTPRSLAARLAGAAAATSATDVVLPLRIPAPGSPEDQLPPLVCVHPAGGLAWFYGSLVAAIPDGRAVYGVQDPSVVLGEQPATSVEQLAQRYVAEVSAVVGDRPVHLLGWSLGGAVAHAMAVQMSENDSVTTALTARSLTIMDSFIDPVDTELATALRVEYSASDAEDGDVLGGWRDMLAVPETVTAAGSDDVAALIRERVAELGVLTPQQVDAVMTSFAESEGLVVEYRPQHYAGDLLFFTAGSGRTDTSVASQSWESVVEQVRNVVVDCAHLGMTTPSALAVIGPELVARLAAGDASTRA